MRRTPTLAQLLFGAIGLIFLGAVALVTAVVVVFAILGTNPFPGS